MTSWQSGDVVADGVRLHYTRTGGGRPPLVLAHGVTDSGLCWTPTARALAADYDVIMADARGHGLSDAPETGYTPLDQAADLCQLIAGLGLRRPAVLGHSMGALTALLLAAAYPDVPGMILLEDPPAFWQRPDPQAPSGDSAVAGMRAWAADAQRKTREELIALQRASEPGWPEEELGPWADSKLQFSLRVFSGIASAELARIDWPALLRRVTCPALLITADADRGACSPAATAELQAHFPGLRVTHIPGAGHDIHRDQPARYLAVVRGFLAAPPEARAERA